MRKILFWIHLCAGCLAGLVIFIMSVTGVLLAFERQINDWADSGYHSSPGKKHFAMESIQGTPTITIRRDAQAPVAVRYGRDKLLYLDRTSGKILGDSSIKTRAFFQKMETVHRALGTPLRRGFGRPITGACNLAFLGLILSGTYLWIPRRWNWKALSPAIWFRRGLRGKARDWNWHNTVGIWAAIPLFFIVLSSVIMSYGWANNLLYILTGSTPPPQAGGRVPSKIPVRVPAGETMPLETLLTKAGSRVPEWQSISFRLPSSKDRTVDLNVDSGTGGQPQKRVQLTFNRVTGVVEKYEDFATNNLGRRLRLIARFLHTGEILGLPGQIVAAFASLGGAFLVYTGIALALRRMAGWIRRRTKAPVERPTTKTIPALK